MRCRETSQEGMNGSELGRAADGSACVQEQLDLHLDSAVRQLTDVSHTAECFLETSPLPNVGSTILLEGGMRKELGEGRCERAPQK